MADTIPMPHDILDQQNTFSASEVGVTHPVQSSHLRLRDNGDIELIAGDVGMVFSNTRRSITFTADSVTFLTKDQQGLRWNNLAFNPKATAYSQPSFLALKDDHVVDLYSGFTNYVPTTKDASTKNPWKGNL